MTFTSYFFNLSNIGTFNFISNSICSDVKVNPQALEEKDGAKKVDPLSGGVPAACTVLVTSHEVISVRDTLDVAFVYGAAPYLKERGSDTLLRGEIDF